MNFETIKCQVSFFYGRLTFFLGFFCPSLPRVKIVVILATVHFIGHSGYEYQR